MQPNTFHPNVTSEVKDSVGKRLKQISQYILLFVCGLFPLFIIFTPYMPQAYGKFLIILSGLTLSWFFFGLSILREGKLKWRLSPIVISAWLVAAVTTLAAIFSGDISDSLVGEVFGTYSAAFTLLVAALITSMSILEGGKQTVMRLYALFIASAVVLSLYHLIRLVFGASVLSFGILNDVTDSTLGGWNALAMFLGLAVILGLLALAQLPLTKTGRLIVLAISLIELCLLLVINFSIVWLVLGVVGSLTLLYVLVKKHWFGDNNSQSLENKENFPLIILSLVTAVISIVLFVGGSSLGNIIVSYTGVSFVEVRPSASATLEIARQVYSEDALFGIGPNKFVDAWRLYKDPTINSTLFWNSNFDSGFSYLGTMAATTGAAGLVAWILFLASLLISGFRLMFRNVSGDRFWYFIGLSSFVTSVYFWGMSAFYSSSSSILVLSAITTGVFVLAYNKLIPGKVFEFSVSKNRNYGFVIIAVVLLMIVGSVGSTYVAAGRYLALYQFNKSLANLPAESTLADIEALYTKVATKVPSDVVFRQLAYYEVAEIQSLISASDLTETQKSDFQQAVSNSISAANKAISLDESEAENWLLLGQIYATLAVVGVEGAEDRAKEAFAREVALSPQDPRSHLMLAEMHAAIKENDKAINDLVAAVRVRPQYPEALYLYAQIQISEGKTEEAIASTAAIVQIEPQNPARRYQLGILLLSLDKVDDAIVVLEQAIALDQQYANARYYLGLAYIQKGRNEDALAQFEKILETNPDNETIKSFIQSLKSGQPITGLGGSEQVVSEEDSTKQITEKDVESDLVTTSNPAPSDAE